MGGAEGGPDGDQVAAVQRAVFLAAAQSRASELGAVRSLLRLYKTIDVPKLAKLAGISPEDVRAGLVALKLHGWRADADEAAAASGGAAASASTSRGVKDSLHFVVGGDDGSMVSTSEAVVARDDARELIRTAAEMRRFMAGGRGRSDA